MKRADVLRLAAETGGDPRTVEKWGRREQVKRVYDYAFNAGATKLRIDRDELDDDELGLAAGGA